MIWYPTMLPGGDQTGTAHLLDGECAHTAMLLCGNTYYDLGNGSEDYGMLGCVPCKTCLKLSKEKHV